MQKRFAIGEEVKILGQNNRGVGGSRLRVNVCYC